MSIRLSVSELKKMNDLIKIKEKLERHLDRARSCYRFGFRFWGTSYDYEDVLPCVNREDIIPIIERKISEVKNKLAALGVEVKG